MSTIRVHLAEVPTDVLVSLVDADKSSAFTIAGRRDPHALRGHPGCAKAARAAAVPA